MNPNAQTATVFDTPLPHASRTFGNSFQKEQAVREHLPLTRWIARQVCGQLCSSRHFDDIAQTGVLGLIDAAERYNPSKGGSFKTYAEYRIRGAILDELRTQAWIPRATREKAKRIAGLVDRLTQEFSRPPTDTEVAYAMKMNLEEYFDFRESARQRTWIPLSHCENHANGSDDDGAVRYERRELRERLRAAIGRLTPREQTVICLYYYEELNLKEIGEQLEVSESRISQLHSSALKKLNRALRREEFR
jgi:RNA polymerase sigma factor for flagellar operon FliA